MTSGGSGGLLGPDGQPIAGPSGSETPGRRTTPNRLAGEVSPYLQQHAYNPVDWYPWGEEALARSRAEDKPIFLSIGYAACHWCHVMERESFENASIARLMNERFVNIKVDREERPDLDDIYMASVQMISGQGGWPMSVFLTPDLRPFFAGTYFPPDDRFGRPGFGRLLEALADAYRTRREEVDAGAEQVRRQLEAWARTPAAGPEPAAGAALDRALVERAVEELGEGFDPRHGGFGGAPKFPHAMSLQLLLRYREFVEREPGSRPGSSSRATEVLNWVELTLARMAAGGIYDHLGGGFHRYSTDERWLVPHFEKMLYDQALLAVAYLEGYQVTGDAHAAQVVRETLDYVLRDLGDPSGGFYSSEDADSEGEEGRFYIWTRGEVESLLGGDALLFCRAYDVDEIGSFEGASILHRARDSAELASGTGRSPAEIERALEAGRRVLFAAREKRPRPLRDEKILTAWNGLAITALARAARVLDEDRYREAAVRCARFLMDRMIVDGVLHRVHREGRTRIPAYLEDHASLINGLVDAYEATYDRTWLEAASWLADSMLGDFLDPEGGFFLTSARHENLLVRMKTAQDSSVPSGNSLAAYALLRLGRLLDRRDLEEHAERALRAFLPHAERIPAAFHSLLLGIDLAVGSRLEIVLAGPLDSPRMGELRAVVDRMFLPGSVTAWTESGAESDGLRAGRGPVNGQPAAYVCRHHACGLPITDPRELEAQLRGERVS